MWRVREEDEDMGRGAIKAEGSGLKSSGERDTAGAAVMNDAAATVAALHHSRFGLLKEQTK